MQNRTVKGNLRIAKEVIRISEKTQLDRRTEDVPIREFSTEKIDALQNLANLDNQAYNELSASGKSPIEIMKSMEKATNMTCKRAGILTYEDELNNPNTSESEKERLIEQTRMEIYENADEMYEYSVEAYGTIFEELDANALNIDKILRAERQRRLDMVKDTKNRKAAERQDQRDKEEDILANDIIEETIKSEIPELEGIDPATRDLAVVQTRRFIDEARKTGTRITPDEIRDRFLQVTNDLTKAA